jgi:arginine/lysine/histidine transporter system substrate-binding protein
MRKNILLLFSILVFLLISSCDNSTEEVEVGKKNLIIGTSADFPPFEFIQDKKIKGFDVDLLKKVAEQAGYSVNFRDITFHGLVPALKTGRIDAIVSAVTATPERSEDVDFSVSYYNPNFSMLFRKNNAVPEINNLNNKSIGVQSGSTMELFLKECSKKDKFKIVSLPRTMPMIQDLKLGRLDGVLLEEAQAKALSSKNELFDYYIYPSHEYGYSIAFRKGSKLKYEFDEVLVGMRASGELEELKKKWLF